VNSPTPHRGKVFFHKQFQFNDGGQSDKLLIVVNEPKGNADWIWIKTTSKPKPQNTRGCHSFSNLFVLEQGDDFLSKKTWVQFLDIYNISTEALKDGIDAGDIHRIGNLKPQNVAAIINCMKKSQDLSPLELSLLK
jgi:hypothetical protein